MACCAASARSRKYNISIRGNAQPAAAGIAVEAVIASLDGARLYRDRVEGAAADAAALGTELADRLLAAGGLDVLHELGLLLDR